MTEFPDFRAVDDAIRSSPAMAYINRSHSRGFSLNIFRMNAQELLEAARHIGDPDRGLDLMRVDNREEGQQAHREINRLVHNFVAGAMTLIDHTRQFMREHYSGTVVKQLYDDRVASDFAAEPVAKFVKDLRNYMLHKGLPDSQMFLDFDSTADHGATLTTGIRYATDAISDWAGWTAPARRYIEAAGKFIDIHTFVENYAEKISKFHEWLDIQLEQFHAEDLAKLRSLQEAQAKMLSSISRVQKSDSPALSEEAPPPPFQFPENLVQVIDEGGEAMLATIRRLEFPSTSRSEFPSERPIAATITSEMLLQTPILWGNDVDGKRVVAFFIDGSDVFGIDEEVHSGLQPLIKKIHEVNWAKNSLSQKFIEASAIDWLRSSFRKDNRSVLSDAILSASRDEVRLLSVWAPVSFLEIEIAFEFGTVRIEPIKAQMIDELEAKGAELAQDDRKEDVHTLFKNIRSKMQGCAAVVVSLDAEPIRAQELGLAIAQDALGLLRFLSPMARTPQRAFPTALMGTEIIPHFETMTLGEEFFSFSEGLISSPLTWRLSKRELESIGEMRLAKSASLITPNGLSEFALAVRASLLLYSTGATFHNPADRLIYSLSSLEGMLLRHSMEPTEFSMEERLSLLLANEKSERAKVAQNVREVYRLRRKHGAALIFTQHDLEALFTFIFNAYTALSIALDNVDSFTRKVDFVDAIDRRKSH